MVIVRMIGGLGNQLFQYGAGRALAKMNVASLKLDIEGFKNEDLRDFDLNKIVENLSFASDDEIKRLKATNSLQRIKERLKNPARKNFYKQPFFHYDERFAKLKDDIYLLGYFQSEKYFVAAKDDLLKEISFRKHITPQIADYASYLQSENSVAVHIRKGDYKNQTTLDYHGILPVNYYRDAIDYIQKVNPGCRLFLFSDEPALAIQDLAEYEFTIVSGLKTSNHFEDLFLMSQCRHNIIANSSFSWWGAWLNRNPAKTVIAPNHWFNNGPKDTQDLLPDNWIKL